MTTELIGEPENEPHSACTDLFNSNIMLLEAMEVAKGRVQRLIQAEADKGVRVNSFELTRIWSGLVEAEAKARGLL